MNIKIIAVLLSLIMIISLCSCSVTINKQESTQTVDFTSSPNSNSKPTAEPVSAESEFDYTNEAAGYGVKQFPKSFKTPNLEMEIQDSVGDCISVNINFLYPEDGHSIDEANADPKYFRSIVNVGTMFFSTAGDISETALLNLGADVNSAQKLQRNDGNILYYILSSNEDRAEDMKKLTENETVAVNAAISDCVEMMKNVITIKKSFPKLSFTTIDFYGNPITSEECFSSSQVTLLNIWASFCGPCEKEMPELVKADEILSKEGCQVLLCLYDTDDRNSEKYKNAVALLERAGASNLKCIIANDEMKKQLDEYVDGYPTSYPIGSDGQVLGLEYMSDRLVDCFVNWVRSYK